MASKEFLLQKIGGYRLLQKNLGKGSFARVELAVHCVTNTKVIFYFVTILIWVYGYVAFWLPILSI